MINKNKLKAEWVKCGYCQKDVAEMLGITPKTLSIKLKNNNMSTNEAFILIQKLNITNPTDIFFASV